MISNRTTKGWVIRVIMVIRIIRVITAIKVIGANRVIRVISNRKNESLL